MMTSIVEEKLVSFKELEKKVFKYVCELGCEILRIMLERYDEELAEERDKSVLRNKGRKETTIKTALRGGGIPTESLPDEDRRRRYGFCLSSR